MTPLDAIRMVLVEPSHPGNIGGAARALKTMGLSQLWLVAPKRFPDPQAEWRAAGGLDVLHDARIVSSVSEALEGCALVVGTSNRNRRIPWPTLDASVAAPRVLSAAEAGPVALLFGREADGLNNEELRACNLHLQIPANPVYPSLNLAMAVQVVSYELYRTALSTSAAPERGLSSTDHWDRPWAKQEAVEAMLTHLRETLEALNFLDPGNPGQTMTRLRRLFLRQRMDDKEVQILRGVLTASQKAALGRKPGSTGDRSE